MSVPKPGDRVRFIKSSVEGKVTKLFKCGGKDCVEVKVERNSPGYCDYYIVSPDDVIKT